MPSPRAGRPPEVREAIDALRRIVQALRAGHTGLGGARLSTAQLFALAQIAEHPGVSINDVAALTFTHQSSVSVIIRRLVRRGFVTRAAARHDRRRQRLDVTPKGRQALRRTPVAVQYRLIDAIASLPPADRRALARSLASVARRVAPEGAGPHPPMFFEGPADRRRAR
jgi:DNA-binding MarR family transcriptional regulator